MRISKTALGIIVIAALVAQAAEAPIKLTETELWRGRALVSKLEQQATLEQLLINQLNRVREEGQRKQQEFAVYQADVLKAHGGTTATHRIDLEAGEVIPAAQPAASTPSGTTTDSTGGK